MIYIFVLRKELNPIYRRWRQHQNTAKIKMKTVVKLVNGTEVARKSGYANLENATNAGNSWKNDCTVHGEIRKNRSFVVISTELENLPLKTAQIKSTIEDKGGVSSFPCSVKRNRPTGCPMRAMAISEIDLLSNEEYYIAFSIGLIGNNGHEGTIINNCHRYQGALAN